MSPTEQSYMRASVIAEEGRVDSIEYLIWWHVIYIIKHIKVKEDLSGNKREKDCLNKNIENIHIYIFTRLFHILLFITIQMKQWKIYPVERTIKKLRYFEIYVPLT